jgi:predicted transposase YbfD/YdcC
LPKVRVIKEWSRQIKEVLDRGVLTAAGMNRLSEGLVRAARMLELHKLDGHAFDFLARFLSLNIETFRKEWEKTLDDDARVYMASAIVGSSQLRDKIEAKFRKSLGTAWKGDHHGDGDFEQSMEAILTQCKAAVPAGRTTTLEYARFRQFFVYIGVWLANLPAKMCGRRVEE